MEDYLIENNRLKGRRRPSFEVLGADAGEYFLKNETETEFL